MCTDGVFDPGGALDGVVVLGGEFGVLILVKMACVGGGPYDGLTGDGLICDCEVQVVRCCDGTDLRYRHTDRQGQMFCKGKWRLEGRRRNIPLFYT